MEGERMDFELVTMVGGVEVRSVMRGEMTAVVGYCADRSLAGCPTWVRGDAVMADRARLAAMMLAPVVG